VFLLLAAALCAEEPVVTNQTVSSGVVKVTGLAKYQNYTLTVAAVTRAGPGVRYQLTTSCTLAHMIILLLRRNWFRKPI
jgi:Sec-independent protein secretion pathway component TatC